MGTSPSPSAVDAVADSFERMFAWARNQIARDMAGTFVEYLDARGFSILPTADAGSRVEELGRLISQLADELAGEIDNRYDGQQDIYPDQMRRFKRDMEIVERARAAIEPLPQPPGAEK